MTIEHKRRWPDGSRAYFLIAALLFAPPTLAAQRVLGPAEDATVIPRGSLRFGISPTFYRFDERFADGLGARPKGRPEPFGADFDLDTLGPRQIEQLRPLGGLLQSITGLAPTLLPVSLGRLRTVYDASVATTPMTLDYGVTRRHSLGVLVPYLRTRNEVLVNPNPDRNEATVGFNPALAFDGARAQNGRVVAELATALTQLQSLVTRCQGSSAPECGAVNADPQRAAQLLTAAAAVSSGIVKVYGTKAGEGARFSPVDRSVLQTAVANRLTALSSDFLAFLGAPGSGTDWIASRPVGAAPIGLEDLNTIITDPELGIEAVPIATVERSHIGDVEFSAKFLLYDSFDAAVPQRVVPGGVKWRVALGGAYRLGVAQRESINDFADIGTGDGQDDVELRLYSDLLLGRRFWASAVARYGVQLADVQSFRIPEAPHDPFPAAYRTREVDRDLGDYVAAELSPRFVLSDALTVGATYSFYSKAQDKYQGEFTATDLNGEPTTLDASILDAGTQRTEQRYLASISYSTMAAYYRGRARIPMEVTYSFGQSLAGSGNQPKQFIQGVGLRFYRRLFGGDDSRPARPVRGSLR